MPFQPIHSQVLQQDDSYPYDQEGILKPFAVVAVVQKVDRSKISVKAHLDLMDPIGLEAKAFYFTSFDTAQAKTMELYEARQLGLGMFATRGNVDIKTWKRVFSVSNR
jgi:hypothetical protein